ncbi:MAG TPA: hypothetical protein VH186_01635 [Chloroflexia bacterium]|nr:hypothetical protein [Chloroflexia bacterium]
MPRYATHQHRWSEKAQAYLLSTNGERLPAAGWLAQISSFSFHSRSGMQFTARKQRVQRGSLLWYVYRRLEKHSLGRTEDFSLLRHEEAASLLESKAAASAVINFIPGCTRCHNPVDCYLSTTGDRIGLSRSVRDYSVTYFKVGLFLESA